MNYSIFSNRPFARAKDFSREAPQLADATARISRRRLTTTGLCPPASRYDKNRCMLGVLTLETILCGFNRKQNFCTHACSGRSSSRKRFTRACSPLCSPFCTVPRSLRRAWARACGPPRERDPYPRGTHSSGSTCARHCLRLRWLRMKQLLAVLRQRFHLARVLPSPLLRPWHRPILRPMFISRQPPSVP